MERPFIPGVTICAVTSVAHDATVAAIRHSLSQISFQKALLLSDACPPSLAGTDIIWRRIAALPSREEYSRFMLHELADHIDTDHVLVVQWDGFVRDGRQWQDAFLGYDYIGAVWPQFEDGRAVGNGGFSLRSKRLLEATRSLPAELEPEDVAICRTHRHELEIMHNLRFAGLEIARQFSYEREISSRNEFGFHGSYNLSEELPSREVMRLIASLEPGVAGSSESVELMLRALARRDFALSRLYFKQVLSHPRAASRILRGARHALMSRPSKSRALPTGGMTNER